MNDLILSAFYLCLPAYFANMAPVVFAKAKLLSCLNKPIDNGRKIYGEFLFGTNKTWRGIASATLVGALTAGLQNLLTRYDFFNQISLVNYAKYWLIFGFLAGFGAIVGDLFKSFLKRRVKIKSGQAWPVFDQLDFIFGFFIFTFFIVNPSWPIFLTAICITLIVHPLTNISAYFLGLKKVWW